MINGIKNMLCRSYYKHISVIDPKVFILKHICEKENIKCNTLKEYIVNRDQYLKEVVDIFNTDIDTAINIFDIILSLNDFEKICKLLNSD